MDGKFVTSLHVCEKCFQDIVKQIQQSNRYKLRGLVSNNSFFREECDCECCCFDECSCSECNDGCEQECDCECKCRELCTCLYGEIFEYECKHNESLLIRFENVRARVLNDKTHLITNHVRRKILDLVPKLELKKADIKPNNPYLYIYLDE